MQHSLEALFISLVPAIGWGVMFFFVTQAARHMDVFRAQFLFQLAGIPMLLLILPFAPPITAPLNFFLIAILGVLVTFVLTLYFHALKIGELAVVGPIYQANIVITVSLAVLFLHDKLYPLKVIGILIILAGIILLGLKLGALKKGITLYKGVAPALLSTLGAGSYLFLVGISSRTNGWFYTALGIRIMVVLTILVVFLTLRKSIIGSFHNVPWKYVGLAALFDVLAFTTFNFAMTRYEVSYVAAMGAVTPAVSTVLALLFLKEKLKVYQAIGLALVIVGVVSLNL